MPKEYFKEEPLEQRGLSRAVRVGNTVYLSGMVGREDEKGRTLSGNFEGQVRATFKEIAKAMERVGGTLDDIVTMTVFITDMKFGRLFQQIRAEYFPHKNGYPASALIGIKELAGPELFLEIQALAVLD